ncbi:DUF7373 family lipoprotein [Nocardia amikacinitolerans]|uniref:DUF7373 family lipoprotein n=1 Tax=Nocardia amikacinitolerans TaxID=756689 RepID=UPI0020A2579F|nr:hypothetical protein [Nocardia amikacinitolerans]
MVAALTAATVVCASCSSTVTGNPGPGMTPVNVADLNTGPYKPEPTEYEQDLSGGVSGIRTIEARRMLNYLVHSYEVDPEIDLLGDIEFFWNADWLVLSNTFPAKYKPAAADNNLVAGAYVSRINSDLRKRKKLIVSVLRFPTEADSKKAAIEFDQITNSEPGRHPVTIEGHPGALASSPDDITAISFLAHGPFVILVNAGVPQPNQSALADVIRRTITLQVARIDQMKLIPLDDILDLPADPDSIMRRALPKAKDSSDLYFTDLDFGAYEPSGGLHFERNPAEVRKAFDESGVDLIGRRGGIVYRTRDLEAAFRLQTVLLEAGRNDEELPPPPGLPDARCLRLDQSDAFRLFDALCGVVYGRYVAVVTVSIPATSRTMTPLYQRAAAQYAILAKSE